jgi:DNA-binding IclR family transcriptional regulator
MAMLQTPRDDAPRAAGTKRRSRTSGIERTVQVLDALRDRGEPMTGYELAKAINAPISTVYALIEELAVRDLLIRDNGSVWLGPRLHHYGLAYARTLDLQTVATHEMQALSRKVKECVQLCGRDGDMMVVLGMVEGPGHFKVTSRVGTRVPLNWTASGRLLVGHLDHAARAAFFRDSAQPSPTGRAVTDPDTLARAAGEAFAERIAVQIGESDFSVACIAAPIRDPAGACAATISIVLPEFRAQKEPERYAAAVKAAAGRIEHRLGWEHAA